MAVVQYGAIVTGLRGKVGGSVFKVTKGGNVLQNQAQARSSGKITKADAGRVINPKANLATLSSSWRSLTSSQRESFNSNAGNFPFLNKFGVEYVGSGFQVFQSLNLNLSTVGATPLVECPSPVTAPATPNFIVTDISASGLEITSTDSLGADFQYRIYATPSQSQGRAFEMSRTRLIAIADDAGFSTGVNIAADYSAQFGTLSVGSFIWIMVEGVNIVTGQSCFRSLENVITI